MQPDPTPDLDEIERMVARASDRDAGYCNMADQHTHWNAIASKLAFLLRAARERDELRAVVSACHEAVGESAESDDGTLAEGIALRLSEAVVRMQELSAQLAEMRAEDELWKANAPDMRAAALAEHARAEKAEARAKELETALRRVALAHSAEIGGDADCFHDDQKCPQDSTCECVVLAVLAQKEPKP